MATWIVEVLAFPYYERDEHGARTDRKPKLVPVKDGPWYERVDGALTKDVRHAFVLDDEKYHWLHKHYCNNPFRYALHLHAPAPAPSSPPTAT